MPQSGPYKVTIFCEGKKMTEYDTKVDGITTSCWIASEAGKSFSFCCENLKCKKQGDPWVRVALLVDGQRVYKAYIGNKAPLVIDGYRHRVSESVVHNYPLIFSAMEFTDDEIVAPIMDMEEVGCIKVEFYQKVKVSVCQRRWTSSNMPQRLEFSNLAHEQSKKLSLHTTTLGKQSVLLNRPATKKRVYCKPYDEHNPGPTATFEFFYRPRDFLKAEGLILSTKKQEKNDVVNTNLFLLEKNREELRNLTTSLKGHASLTYDDFQESEMELKREKLEEPSRDPGYTMGVDSAIDLTND